MATSDRGRARVLTSLITRVVGWTYVSPDACCLRSCRLSRLIRAAAAPSITTLSACVQSSCDNAEADYILSSITYISSYASDNAEACPTPSPAPVSVTNSTHLLHSSLRQRLYHRHHDCYFCLSYYIFFCSIILYCLPCCVCAEL